MANDFPPFCYDDENLITELLDAEDQLQVDWHGWYSKLDDYERYLNRDLIVAYNRTDDYARECWQAITERYATHLYYQRRGQRNTP